MGFWAGWLGLAAGVKKRVNKRLVPFYTKMELKLTFGNKKGKKMELFVLFNLYISVGKNARKSLIISKKQAKINQVLFVLFNLCPIYLIYFINP